MTKNYLTDAELLAKILLDRGVVTPVFNTPASPIPSAVDAAWLRRRSN